MAEQLKNLFGVDIPETIAGMIAKVFPRFPAEDFIRDSLDGYADLELFPRGRKIARAMKRHLPEDYSEAAGILIESLGPKLDMTEGSGMAPFVYLPHVFFVAEFGLDHFEDSMRAQYELTQRFSAEFSIRPYIEKYPHATLARLEKWTGDSSAQVRRLVSEGTRPRLPWAPRLRAFQIDPRPVLTLLEKLKDDPELYVRRSVANNLNDIGKDHPAVLVDVSRRWLKNAPKSVVGSSATPCARRLNEEKPGRLRCWGSAKRSASSCEKSASPLNAPRSGNLSRYLSKSPTRVRLVNRCWWISAYISGKPMAARVQRSSK